MGATILAVLYAALSVAFSVVLACSVNSECNEKGINHKGKYVAITLLFGWIGFIIFKLSNRKVRTENEGPEPPKARSKPSLACAVILFALTFIVNFASKTAFNEMPMDTLFSSAFSAIDNIIGKNSTFYDMKGNPYDSKEDILYYDRDGNTYKLDGFEFDGDLVCVETGDRLNCVFCYVDGEGYLYYDKDNKLKYNEEYDYYYDGSSKVYYPATLAEWNSRGRLLNNEINY